MGVILFALSISWSALESVVVSKSHGTTFFNDVIRGRIVFSHFCLAILNSIYGAILVCRDVKRADRYYVHWFILIQLALLMGYWIL
ncbi:MAG: hypothetical protein IKS45_08050 [Thermoguttaceae bacterium]|nr:hypothetical protein [Thermoguttaceae bacterium]